MSHSFVDMFQFGTSAWQPSHADLERHIRLTNGDDTYRAADDGEYILALDGNDLVIGGAGDDTILGGAGDDELYGARKGKDYLDGGNGNDVLFGSRGHDQLLSGRGDDDLHSDAGPDIMDGGEGHDRIDVNSNDSDGARDINVYNLVSDSTRLRTHKRACGRVDELIQWRRRGGTADGRPVLAERGADAPYGALFSAVARAGAGG